jgi:S1-C subfamily serine protease
MSIFPVRPVRPIWPVLLLSLLTGVLAWRLWFHERSGLDPHAQPRLVIPRGDLAGDEQATIDIFQNASPSVVHITTLTVRRDFFRLNPAEAVPEGTGSGIIWDNEGHIVTNFHVIQNANGAQVTLADHSSWSANLVGYYADKDLAVLSINAPGVTLHPIAVGTSANLQVGQKAFAIGNPFGLDQTLTTGVVSALGREIESVTHRPITGVIQTDASINPGNSGGPLLDSAGLLIGVNVAIYSPSGASVGIGFAIPVDTVNRFVPELIRHGQVVRPGLGITPVDDAIARQLGSKGVLFVGVEPRSGAANAGLRATRQDRTGRVVLGDIIVAIDGTPIQSADDLYRVLDRQNVGDTVAVTVRRDDHEITVDVTLTPID